MENNELMTYLIEELKSLKQTNERLNRVYETPEIGELCAALAEAQASFKFAELDANNPHFRSKYATLQSIVHAAKDGLSKNGLCVIQRILPNGGGSYLCTRLAHKSGQWIESRVLIDPSSTQSKSLIQGFGSALTYMRRYSYCSILGIATGENEDDGEMAADVRVGSPAPRVETPKPVVKPKLSVAQHDTLIALLEGHQDVRSEFESRVKTADLSTLEAQNFKTYETWITKKIAAKEEHK